MDVAGRDVFISLTLDLDRTVFVVNDRLISEGDRRKNLTTPDQEATMTSISRLLETALYVDDLDRSCAFYQSVLGLGPVLGTSRESKIANRALRPLDMPGGQVLLLFPKGSATKTATLPGGTIPPHDGSGRLHLAFAISAEELDAWRERLHSHGVAIEGEMTWPRGGTSLYFRDPDGHLVELATPGLWPTY
jgi:catechol 2,3-dioxygenase-like lactoylglutathione lyase family enzyme